MHLYGEKSKQSKIVRREGVTDEPRSCVSTRPWRSF